MSPGKQQQLPIISQDVELPTHSTGVANTANQDTGLGHEHAKHVDFEPFAAKDNDTVLHLRRRSSLGSILAQEPHGHSSWLTAAGHLVTAIIGAGVLGLPSSLAWLGWVGGLLALVVFFGISLWCALMLTEVYMVNGRRHTRYKFAVASILGGKHSLVLSVAQHANMILTTIGYSIAAADSMSYVARRVCEAKGTPLDQCFHNPTIMGVIFGGVQLLMSQLPNLESAWWASAIGALMSFGYSFIAVGLGAAGAWRRKGDLMGRPAPVPQKAFGVMNALGNFGFAYSCAIILLEVQDTLREPPAASKSMRKTVPLALGSAFTLYLLVSVFGYAALGNDAPASILTGFDSAPIWVTILANLMVLTHMVPAYQVYAQPVFATIEDNLLALLPALDKLGNKDWILRLVYRSIYVMLSTLLATALPFFSAFVGLVGAVTFWPTAVYFPIAMWSKIYRPHGFKKRLMLAVNILMGVVSVLATVGSIQTIISSAAQFKPFGAGAGSGSP